MRSRSAGFSLIEILMVLFVVVLLTSLVSLNLDGGGRERLARQRLDGLIALAKLALDEALTTGSDFGVLLVRDENEDGEAVLRALWRQRGLAGWRRPEDPLDLFGAIEFPPGYDLRLRLDDEAVLPLAPVADEERAGRQPQWLLTASGETQTGELLLVDAASDRVLWRASWDALGRFTVFRGEALESEEAYAERL